jgi:hypothetical protein
MCKERSNRGAGFLLCIPFLFFFVFFYSPAALLEFTKEMKKEVLDLNKPWLNCI